MLMIIRILLQKLWVFRFWYKNIKKISLHLKRTSKSLHVDEIYIKVKGKWTYLYRGVEKEKRDAKGSSRFFEKILKANHTQTPRGINVDKNPALSCAIG